MRYLSLVLTLLVAAGAYSGYWFHVAGRIAPGLAEWAEARRAEGYAVDYGSVMVSGFPYRLVIEVENPAVARPGGDGAWRWAGPKLGAVAQPWNLRHVIFVPEGRHTLAYRANGTWRELWAEAEAPLVSVVADEAGNLSRFSIDLQGLKARSAEWSEALTAARAQLHGRDPEDTEEAPSGARAPRDFALKAEAIHLPPEIEAPLGRKIARLEARVTFEGILPRGPLPESAAAWRDDGGTVEISDFRLNWGPLGLEGSGTLTLDDQMRPLGAASTRVKGHEPTIDSLVAGGKLGKSDGRTLKAALGLLVQEGADGPVLKVPLNAQDGRVYVGPLPLFRLRPLLPLESKKPS